MFRAFRPMDIHKKTSLLKKLRATNFKEENIKIRGRV